MTSYEFNVEMTCSGCSDTMTRLLTRQKDKSEINDFSVDLVSQTVIVTTGKTQTEVTEILEKSGKKVTFLKSYAAKNPQNDN